MAGNRGYSSLYVSTYALSSTVLPLVQRAKVPVVVLNLQPVAALDYERFNRLGDRGRLTGEWLAHCQAWADSQAWQEIEDWLDAARVAAIMRDNRVGVLGHYYCGMLDVYSDLTQQSAALGTHFEILEIDELRALRDGVPDAQIETKLQQLHTQFEVSKECSDHELGALAYYYEGTAGSEHEDIISSVIAGNSLLTGAHVPVAVECEVKNVQSMKIMDSFGAGGSFSELYLMDFEDDVVFLGHDGPAHFAVAEGKGELVPLPVYHGKPGKGVSIQMTVRHGPVTLLSVVQDGQGAISLLVAEGQSVPGPVLEIGNTNSRYRFCVGARGFVNEWSKAGPAHHCAVGVGHIANKVQKLAGLLHLGFRRIC